MDIIINTVNIGRAFSSLERALESISYTVQQLKDYNIFSSFLSYDIIKHTDLRPSFEIIMVNPLNHNEI